MTEMVRSGIWVPRGRGALLPLCAALLVAGPVGMSLAAPRAPAAVAKSNGAAVGKLAFRDLDGKSYSDRDLRAGKATLFLFLSTECPISRAYTGRIVELASAYQGRGVRFFGVNTNDETAPAQVAQDAQERGFRFPIVKDADGTLAARLGARVTPEAVLVDRQGVVRYQGRIDDNKDAARVRAHDLQDALEAVLAGKRVAVARTEAFGCAIVGRTASPAAGGKKPANAVAQVTYTHDVAPILQKSCQGCHRPGEIGPFPLMSYEQARRWAGAIKDYTRRRAMPPWKAEPGVAAYANSRALTERARLPYWQRGCGGGV